MGKWILPTQRSMAFQKAVKKIANVEMIVMSHNGKFLFDNFAFAFVKRVLGINPH